MRMLTWNVGGLHTHVGDICQLLVSQGPHIVLLQEARDRAGAVPALRTRLRSLDYTLHHCPRTNLLTIWRRGLKVAPISPSGREEEFRVQPLAVMIKNRRVVIRNIHAPADSGAARRDLATQLYTTRVGCLTIDCGDFNEVPTADADSFVLFPSTHTFRKSPDEPWLSTLDGCKLPRQLAPGGSIQALSPSATSQHRPVRIDLNLHLDSFDTIRWSRHNCEPRNVWTHEERGSLQEAIRNQRVDDAWSLWAQHVNYAPPQCVADLYGASFVTGKGIYHRELHRLWKKVRRLESQHSASGDETAQAILGDITSLLDTQAAAHLAEWKKSVSTRTGSARWVRRKLDRMATDSAPLDSAPLGFSLELWGSPNHHSCGVCYHDFTHPLRGSEQL